MRTPSTEPARLKQQIAESYDRFAPRYDWLVGIAEVLFIRRLRRNLLRTVRGDVLEVAVGTGANLGAYPSGCRITAVDMSPGMLRRAERRAERLGLTMAFRIMDAEQLAFPNASFDTVVSTLATCTFPDPVAALKEMGRVTRPGGNILMLEHGRSNRRWLGRYQDKRVGRHASQLGCAWNREPQQLAAQAGLTLEQGQRTFLGMVHMLRLRPEQTS